MLLQFFEVQFKSSSKFIAKTEIQPWAGGKEWLLATITLSGSQTLAHLWIHPNLLMAAPTGKSTQMHQPFQELPAPPAFPADTGRSSMLSTALTPLYDYFLVDQILPPLKWSPGVSLWECSWWWDGRGGCSVDEWATGIRKNNQFISLGERKLQKRGSRFIGGFPLKSVSSDFLSLLIKLHNISG